MIPALRDLLRDLVATASPSGDEGPCAELARDVLARGGLDVELVGESVLARLAGRAPGPHLFLNSHLDTVPAGAGWDADPWDVSWKGDRLCGLGANDAKASAAAMMWAAMQAARERPAAGTLTLALTASEETNNAGMTAVLEHLKGERFDAAVTGEPTGLAVVRAQSGLAVLEATWHGRACHAAHVSRVAHVNALSLAARDLGRFGTYHVLGQHELLGPSTLVPTVLRAGTRHNVVPDRAEAVFDARLAPGHDADECVAVMHERMPDAEVRVRSARLKPVETAADHPFVVLALECAGQPQAIGSNTLSDMALLQGVPAVKCGPGETARSHTPNEFVTADELERGGAFYRALIPSALAALTAGGARPEVRVQ